MSGENPKLKELLVTNEFMGEQYQLVRKETAPEEFKKLINLQMIEPSENLYAFVVYGRGSKIWPLYMNQYYYVMTESGKTFENLRY